MKFKHSAKASLLIASLVLSSYAMSSNVVTDTAITAAVKTKIATDSALSGTNISTTTKHGVVHLSGNVKSDTQANEATEAAQSVSGVSDVDTSNLTVNGSEKPLADSMITAKIKGMYVRQKLFGDADVAAMTIKVETVDGVVSLSGTADNQQQIDNAISIAKSITGVKSVNSTVKVGSDAASE